MRCWYEDMNHPLSRALTVSAMSLCVGVFAIASCTRTTDRVIEPVGGGDASTTVPETGDAAPSLIGPVARTPEHDTPPDFTLVRSPELGSVEQSHRSDYLDNGLPGQGGNGGAGGSAGGGGSGSRPVSSAGGLSYF